jgi:hypothetical protein
MRGAVAKGLEGKGTPIETRKSRRHYGTTVSRIFVAGRHRKNESYICSFDGQLKADNQAEWLVQKGKDLPTSKEAHATKPVSTRFWAYEQPSAATYLELLACNEDAAPSRSLDQVGLSFLQ